MSRFARLSRVLLVTGVLLVTLPVITSGQRRAMPRHPPHPQPVLTVRGHVFIGGYFYDPVFGPYPWWPRPVYPRWYIPVYDQRAALHVRVKPGAADDAAVYVDGFYAGIVDDFNNVFQSLPLTPGGHQIVLFLEGYRTVRHNIYLRPGSDFTLRVTMERLPAGEISERPDVAPPVPPPPTGSYRTPSTPPPLPAPSPPPAIATAAGFGTLDLYVQPGHADVTIDGERWVSSDEGHFVIQVAVGRHRIEVSKAGYRPFATELEIRDRETSPLNVSLLGGVR